jgi:hypothetical protein
LEIRARYGLASVPKPNTTLGLNLGKLAVVEFILLSFIV